MPDAGRDGGLDAGGDAGEDGGAFDAGRDGGADAALDGGLDAGVDGGLDAGFDGGPSPFAAVPRDGGWVFVPFADAYCANGTTTGVGASFPGLSDDLLIFLAPGGACWDQATCDPTAAGGCAINMNTGYGETHGTPAWSGFPANGAGAGSIFDRTVPGNPMADFNDVFVFYCTGDTHAGSRINGNYFVRGPDGGRVPVHHLGYQNLLVYLEALAATFNPGRVVLAGTSAGGFGSYLDYAAVAEAFPNATVFMFDDSGPMLPNPDWPPDSGDTLAEAWNLAAATPPGCTGCLSDAPDAGPAVLAGYLSRTYPQGRMSLVSSDEDENIRQRYRMDGGQYAAALQELETSVLDPLPNWRYFVLAGDTHTALQGYVADDTPCGRTVTSVPGLTCSPTLLEFIEQELASTTDGGLQAWQSATPPAGAPGTQMTPEDAGHCSLGN